MVPKLEFKYTNSSKKKNSKQSKLSPLSSPSIFQSKSHPLPSPSITSKFNTPSFPTPQVKLQFNYSTNKSCPSPSHSSNKDILLSPEEKLKIQKLRESLRNVAKELSNHDEYVQENEDNNHDVDCSTPANKLTTPISTPSRTPSKCPLPPTSGLRRSARVAARKHR